MPTPPVAEEVSIAHKTAIEGALTDGFSPYRTAGGKGSSVQEAARRLGMKDTRLVSWLRRQEKNQAAGKPHWLPDWSLWSLRVSEAPVRSTRSPARRYLLTAAQDDTPVHARFWANLQAYAKHMGAEIIVGGFTYNKGLFEDHASRTAVFAEAVQPFMRHERVDLGPIDFCAEMNVLPTAVRPLSGLEGYTGLKWGVFPHAKVQLVSVPTYVTGPVKMLMTTGACTVENYIAKKAGLKAAFHHIIGATIVEIDSRDRVFCRQVNATSDGDFQDLDVQVKAGKVTTGHRVEAIVWGDVHRRAADPSVALTAWGLDLESEKVVTADTMLDVLRPRYQFWHDLVDFGVRNHHRIKDQHHRFAMLVGETDLVEDEIAQAARFLRQTQREWCRSVVVYSNHDDALVKWLKTADYREDVANAPFFLRCQARLYQSIADGEEGFNVFRWIMGELDGRDLEDVDFVDDNQSFIICQSSGGIECGGHGHLGINGARGSAAGLVKTAMRINRGHEHSASILDGVYTAGLCGLMDQGYNRGLSSWSHTQIVTYASGKRSLVCFQNGKWRA